MHSFHGLVHSFLRRCWFISQDWRLFRKIFAFFASYSVIIFDGLALGWYDQILNTMWRSGDNNDFAERAKAQFAKNPYEHSGFVSEVAGAAYANKDIALTYLPSDKESLKLLENEDAAELLKMLSDKNVRLVLAYQFENPEKAFTASSAAAKVGISEEEAKAALEKLFECNMTTARDIDAGLEEMLRIYQAWGTYKMPLLLFPLLSLADRLAHFRENWYGFRG